MDGECVEKWERQRVGKGKILEKWKGEVEKWSSCKKKKVYS